LKYPRHIITLLLFITAYIVLNLDVFSPVIGDINRWDEAFYIHQAELLYNDGFLPELSQSPLIALVDAGIFHFVQHSVLWMTDIISINRILTVICLWIIIYITGYKLRDHIPMYALPMLLLFTPMLRMLTSNASDSFFTILCSLALLFVLLSHLEKNHRYLIIAGILTGLSQLARNDGFFFFLVLLCYSIYIAISERARLLPIAIIVSFLCIPVLYSASQYLMQDDVPFHLLKRIAFVESAQELAIVDYSGIIAEDIHRWNELGRQYYAGDLEFYEIYLQNPVLVLRRMFVLNVYQLPDQFLKAYGNTSAVLIAIMVILGIVKLVKEKRKRMLVILLAWYSPALLYQFFFYRSGYLLLGMLSIMILASLGFEWTYEHRAKRFRFSLAAVFTSISLAGLIFERQLLFTAFLLFAVYILLDLYYEHRLSKSHTGFVAALLGIFFVVQLINNGFQFSPSAADDGYSQTVEFIAQEIPDDASIASADAAVVWASQRKFNSIDSLYIRNADLHSSDIDFLYVNSDAIKSSSYKSEILQVLDARTPVYSSGIHKIYRME
jgi:dolichyl-phosphate-mannose-protein mannosyltransferase